MVTNSESVEVFREAPSGKKGLASAFNRIGKVDGLDWIDDTRSRLALMETLSFCFYLSASVFRVRRFIRFPHTHAHTSSVRRVFQGFWPRPCPPGPLGDGRRKVKVAIESGAPPARRPRPLRAGIGRDSGQGSQRRPRSFASFTRVRGGGRGGSLMCTSSGSQLGGASLVCRFRSGLRVGGG